jgi:hypothetical protein
MMFIDRELYELCTDNNTNTPHRKQKRYHTKPKKGSEKCNEF